jgi:hypothetical protein
VAEYLAQPRIEVDAVGGDGLDRLQELRRRPGLERHAADAEGERLAEATVLGEAGVEEDLLLRPCLEHRACELDPVSPREAHVDEGDVGHASDDHLVGRGDDLGPAGDRVQGPPQDRLDAEAHGGVVLDDRDGEGLAGFDLPCCFSQGHRYSSECRRCFGLRPPRDWGIPDDWGRERTTRREREGDRGLGAPAC